MERTETLVIGAGVSGLAWASFAPPGTSLVIEAEQEIGGYCRTVVQDGFVWDYSGHFFHFKRPEMEAWLLARMPPDEVKVVQRQSAVWYGDRDIDFPFQKNIHQLPQAEFIECLYDLYFRQEMYGDGEPTDFRDMLYLKFGRGIAERFLIPYNEKLYACDLGKLDVHAMGRFFPHADVPDIIRNFRQQDNASYNATFTYPRGGAIQYVRALAHDVDPASIRLGERVLSLDLERKVAVTTRGEIGWERVVSSAPLPSLLGMCGWEAPAGVLSWNRVLVFNLGFDGKGKRGVHWVYFPQRDVCFYRIGYYDNIFDTDRMSLYVEVGFAADAPIDVAKVRDRVLIDLARVGVIAGHTLVSEHHVVLDPAYVHITQRSQSWVGQTRAALADQGVHSIGRYGAWTYCSIEDNMVEARDLAGKLTGGGVAPAAGAQ
jgi:protoporphyrinogen oxidase